MLISNIPKYKNYSRNLNKKKKARVKNAKNSEPCKPWRCTHTHTHTHTHVHLEK